MEEIVQSNARTGMVARSQQEHKSPDSVGKFIRVSLFALAVGLVLLGLFLALTSLLPRERPKGGEPPAGHTVVASQLLAGTGILLTGLWLARRNRLGGQTKPK